MDRRGYNGWISGDGESSYGSYQWYCKLDGELRDDSPTNTALSSSGIFHAVPDIVPYVSFATAATIVLQEDEEYEYTHMPLFDLFSSVSSWASKVSTSTASTINSSAFLDGDWITPFGPTFPASGPPPSTTLTPPV
jgi:hypothetical protein